MDEFKCGDDEAEHGPDAELLPHVDYITFIFDQCVFILCHLLALIVVASVYVWVPPGVKSKGPCPTPKRQEKTQT